MNNTRANLQSLVFCGIMAALGTALSLIKVWQMPLGGSVTLLSMLPVILVSRILGIRWGTACAFVFSLIQLMLGIATEGVLGWGLTPLSLFGTIVLDYILPFTLLGLAGAFSKRGLPGVCLGTAAVMVIRFLCHFVSGIIIFGIWSPWESVYIYSLCYNGAFMLPELITTLIAVIILEKTGVNQRIGRLFWKRIA